MDKTHYKKMRNPNYLGSWDLPDGKDLVVTIKGVRNEEVFNPSDNGKEICLVMVLEGNYKPLILNSTNCKSIAKAVGSPYVEDWVGSKIALYSKKVKAFGDTVDAIRVREYAPKLPPKKHCEHCKAEIKPAYGMEVVDLVAYTKSKYGQELCAKCASERKAELEKQKKENENE